MRSPEHRNTYSNRRNQVYDNEISSRFTTPGAFTVLPPDDVAPPDPPLAPQPYRLTPSARRHKNMSFAILAEPTSAPGSRSPSPTGRVSPFRGRGFNPIGSRHASPIPSPPPEEMYRDVNEVSRLSKIPRLSRRGSAAAFGEKINDYQASPKGKLHSQLSQSLTNIAPKKVTNRPPPSPRRRQGYSKPPAFQRLSPIVGSSPEPSQSQSSPKNINTRSQPHKSSSPVRSQSFVNRPPRPTSKAPSRNTSREPSPNKNPTSPTRIPVKQHYKNVQAKVNSFSKPKPKVPPKPQVLNEETTEESDNTVNTRKKIPRKESVKLRTNSKNNVIPKAVTNSNNKSNNNNKTNNKNDTLKETVNDKSGNNTNVKEAANKTVENIKEDLDKITEIKDDIEIKQESTNTVVDNSSENDTKTKPQEEVKKTESPVKLADLLQPSTTTVVSSTTSTVTQPLKIEAKIDMDPKIDSISKSDNKTMSPIVDGRVLSATSVSNAMNKMNDTVLNTRTLMKETGLTKLSPAASSIIAMSNVSKQTNPALDTKNATTALPSVEEITTKPLENNSKSTDNKDKTTDNKAKPTDNKDKPMDNNQKPPENNHKPLENNHKRPENTNHVTTTGIISAKALEEHVQNNMSKLISPDHIVSNSVQKSVNDRIIEARTVVAHDVKPIKITVKEKPMDADVQSGNIRFDTSNGLNEIPGLPPPQQPGNEPQPEVQEPPKGNACTRFFATWKKKMNFKTCKRQKPENNEEIKNTEEKPAKAGCFNCRKKKPDVTINIENDEPKQKIWDRLKCCSKNKVGDTGCFPIGKRKSNWTERQDSIMSEPPANKSRCSKRSCTNLFRRLFCLDKCRKNKKKIEQDNISRRASMMSKKKSLTPSVPVEDNKPKIDISLVEHSSQMRGAIPVLPVCLAWFCLVMNCIGPGTGTILSGLFCLCIGKPRFSQKDGPKPRIGAFIIDLIIGFGQFFTVLFCLVGWGWSIWWGVIMVKIAKKHKKIKMLEANAMEHEGSRQVPPNQNHSRDPERGS